MIQIESRGLTLLHGAGRGLLHHFKIKISGSIFLDIGPQSCTFPFRPSSWIFLARNMAQIETRGSNFVQKVENTIFQPFE